MFKYAKVLLLTPAIGGVATCFAGVLLGAVLLVDWGRSGSVAAVNPGGSTIQSGPKLVAAQGIGSSASDAAPEGMLQQDRRSAAISSTSRQELAQISGPNSADAGAEIGSDSGPAIPEAPTPRLIRAVFEKPLARDQIGFLSEFAGRPSNDVVHEQKLRSLVDKVVPYAPFHIGLDLPLPMVIEGMMSQSALPVEVRDGRYAMVYGRRGENARGRAFLWIDLQEGVALGGIFFYPSNGEPTPTLTLFSRQVMEGALGMSQLPMAFTQDLARWVATEGIPTVTTRYLINASNEKVLLAHDEDFCKQDVADGGGDGCEKMNAEAAEIDRKAAHYLEQTRYASNATMRSAVD